ncbi:MAG: hypothetical protein GX442_14185 [Candidatus Riflebacteria bacterium]|nr:hypothetical protein [Candidatus Riflebacteria bacterium]
MRQTAFRPRAWRAFAAVVCCLLPALAAWGFDVPEIDTQKFPVEVHGDYLEYRTKANQVVTKGRAFISYKDLRLSADTIQANTKSEDIFAHGSVDFWKGYDQTRGDFMVYNMKTGKGWMRDATIRRNRNFFQAKDVYVSPAYSLAHDIMQTTCDEVEHPHYRIQAKSIEIIPGHEMTMEGLALKWKGKTLYRKGIDRSSLFEKDKRFFNTRQGMSAIDGVYFKFGSDLEVTPQVKGRFGIDWFEKRGMGTSFSGTYTSPDGGNGSINIYNLDESKRNHKNLQVSLSNNYRFARGDTLATNLSYTGDQVGGQAENKDLNVQMNLNPVLRMMNMNVTASKFFDLDGDSYNLDNGYQILNRLPEINMSFPAYTFPVVPLSMNVTGMFGRYEEGTLETKKDTEKKDLRSNFSVPTVKVNRRFEFTPTYNLQKSWYSEGVERENGTTMVRANHKFSPMTDLEFNYNLSTQKGKSPFRFDSFSKTDVLSFRLRVATSTWTFNPVNFNYNRAAQRLEQVYWDFSKRSDPDAYRTWEFFVRRDYVPDPVSLTSMSMTRLTPGNLNMRYRLASALWSFDTSITYPHEYRRVTNTSLNYRTVIRPLWQIGTNANFNHLTGQLTPFSLSIIRDLHCWEAKAEYNRERKEFWIEFYLKAYPEDTGRFRYGADTKRLEAKLAAYDQMTQRYDQFRNQ